MKKNYSFLMCVLLLAACGKSNSADVRGDDRERIAPPTGELSKNVNELLSSEWAEDCDHAADAQMREMSKVLDSKVSEINKVMATMPPSKTSKLVPFGESYLKEYIVMPESKDEWTTDEESWADAYKYYLEIKDQPMNRNWINLNSDVRSLILNDQLRILDGANMNLHHDSGAKVDSLKIAVDSCVVDTKCKKPSFTKDDENFISSVKPYRYYNKKIIKNQNDAAVIKETLLKFQTRLLHDQGRFAFRPNKSITIKSENDKTELDLPIDGSIFTEQQKTQLQGYIESVWTSADLSLKIKWSAPLESIFKMFFEMDKPGERAYVNWHDQEIHLFPMTRTRAVAHEFGHVIGFKDHYYTAWDAKRCVYPTEGNSGDLMSDVAGNVTAAEWMDLKNHYPVD